MVDLELSAGQKELQRRVRSFVEENVLPVAEENDANHYVDTSIIRGMGEMGLLGATIPEKYGGLGLDFVSLALIAEEIERGDASFRTLLSVHLALNSMTLLKFASEEQKEKYLIPQATGEALACFALTEPGAGSDAASTQTTAERKPDGSYALSGHKRWIGFASMANYLLVFAKTDPQAGHRGISAFILEKEVDGLSTREIEHKLGLWASSTGERLSEKPHVLASLLVIRRLIATYMNASPLSGTLS